MVLVNDPDPRKKYEESIDSYDSNVKGRGSLTFLNELADIEKHHFGSKEERTIKDMQAFILKVLVKVDKYLTYHLALKIKFRVNYLSQMISKHCIDNLC